MTMPPKLHLFCILLCTLLQVTFGLKNSSEINNENDDDVGNERDGKFLSLFNIVTFKNDPCTIPGESLTGTCMSNIECQNAGGSNQGNCAAGKQF